MDDRFCHMNLFKRFQRTDEAYVEAIRKGIVSGRKTSWVLLAVAIIYVGLATAFLVWMTDYTRGIQNVLDREDPLNSYTSGIQSGMWIGGLATLFLAKAFAHLLGFARLRFWNRTERLLVACFDQGNTQLKNNAQGSICGKRTN